MKKVKGHYIIFKREEAKRMIQLKLWWFHLLIFKRNWICV